MGSLKDVNVGASLTRLDVDAPDEPPIDSMSVTDAMQSIAVRKTAPNTPGACRSHAPADESARSSSVLSDIEEDIPRRFSSRINKLSVLPDERERIRSEAPL